MSMPYTVEDPWRVHDIAVMNWLMSLRVNYGEIEGVQRPNEKILTIMAAPHRAFADVYDLLVERGWMTQARVDTIRGQDELSARLVPLPLFSVERMDPLPDPELGQVPAVLRTTNGNVPFPKHYRGDYNVTLWAKRHSTENFVRSWVAGQFGNRGCGRNEMLLPVVHVAPYGTANQSFRFVGASRQDELEGNQPTYTRTQYTFNLRYWIIMPTNVNVMT